MVHTKNISSVLRKTEDNKVRKNIFKWMKSVSAIVLAIVVCMLPCFKEKAHATEVVSLPVIVIEKYQVTNDKIVPGENFTLTLFLKNCSDKTSAENIIKSITSSLNIPYPRVLYALGIRYVGETVAKKLANAFPSIEQLQSATLDELTHIDEIGERIAKSVIQWFSDEDNHHLIKRLKEAGLQFQLSEEALSNRTDKLAGKSIVISGVFTHHSRDEYKALIEQHGGKNVGSISGKTSFILAGENMGPSKFEKANKLGVAIINEEDFLKMIN